MRIDFRPSAETQRLLQGHEAMRSAFRYRLTPEQQQAVRAYTVLSVRAMNRVAAQESGGESVDRVRRVRSRDRHAQRVRLLQQALLASPRLADVSGAPDSVTIYRGVWNYRAERKLTPENALRLLERRLPVGSLLDDGIQHRFNSWSLLPAVVLPFSRRRGHTDLILRLNDHYICNYYGSHGLVSREADFIMPIGSRFQVVRHSIEDPPGVGSVIPR